MSKASIPSDGPSVAGRLFAPLSPRFVAGRLHREGDEMVFVAGEDTWRLPHGDMEHVSARVGAATRRLRFADGSLFETEDNDGIDRLLGNDAGGGGLLSALEVFHPRLAIVVVATVLAIIGLVQYGVPAAANTAAYLTPSSVRTLIDTTTMGAVDRLITNPTALAEGQRERFQAALDSLASVGGRSDYTLLFRSAPTIGPNAFALPGGTIVVTDQLVRFLDNDDQIIAILAHEMAHVDHNHGLRRLYRAYGYAVMVGLITGDFGELAGSLAEAAGLMAVLANSRAFEREADMEGVRILEAAGRDPEDLAAALEALAAGCAACGESSIMSTHPGIPERAEAIRSAR